MKKNAKVNKETRIVEKAYESRKGSNDELMEIEV